MQWLVSIVFKSDTHRPSSVKLWQMPQPEALPVVPALLRRVTPLEAHETSYFADSVRICSLFITASSYREYIHFHRYVQKLNRKITVFVLFRF